MSTSHNFVNSSDNSSSGTKLDVKMYNGYTCCSRYSLNGECSKLIKMKVLRTVIGSSRSCSKVLLIFRMNNLYSFPKIIVYV